MLVSASLLSANFADLRADIETLNASATDYYHIDIMDGVFVPNISFGFPVLDAIARHATLPLDVHMMTVEPQNYIDRVAATGAEIMTVHYEACTHLHRTLQAIRNAGMKAGVSINPATPVELLIDTLDVADLVLIMSVNPGFGGQKFIPRSTDKVRRLRSMIDSRGLSTVIEVDGGVNVETGRLLSEAGTDIVVAGNSIFSAPDMTKAVDSLKAL